MPVMHWYLIHTKPKQEHCALRNLEQQGYECYLPVLPTEKRLRGVLTVAAEPLFPRYLFIQLDKGDSAKGWGPIRSTRGVSSLVSFGGDWAKVDDRLIALLKSRSEAEKIHPRTLFSSGERVKLAGGSFAGIEGIYQMANGESRAIVLIELMSKSVPLSVSPANLRKVG